MNQGALQNVQWPADDVPVETDNVVIQEQPIDWHARTTPPRWPRIAAALLIGLAAIGWLAMLAIGISRGVPPGGLSLLRLAAWIGIGSAPLALLALLYLMVLRSGRAEAGHYARVSAQLRADTESLAAALSIVTERIEQARGSLAMEASELRSLGKDTGARIAGTAAELRGQAQAFGDAAATFENATTQARADLGVLLSDLPQAEDVARSMAERLREGSAEADARIRALTSLLVDLEAKARTAGEGTGGAAARLAGQLDRIEASAAAADRRIEDAAISMGRAVDITMTTVAEGVEETRAAIADQSQALTALSDQSRATIGAVGDSAISALSARLDELVARVDTIGNGLRGQENAARALLGQLEHAIAGVEARFVSLGDVGAEHAADLAESVVALAGHTEAVGRALGSSNQVAETLLARVAQVRSHAEASSVAICDTIPSALSRVRLHAEQSLQAIATASDSAGGLSEVAATIGERLSGAQATLDQQKATLEEVGALAGERLDALHGQTAALEVLLAKANSELRSLAEGTTGELIEALSRVRESAAEASDHARDAISAVIPRVAQRLSESAARTLSQTISDVGQSELAGIGAASEQAIEAARVAAERLTRQLVTIAETSTAIEARIVENRELTEAHDEASFARSVGLLIEALNSTAIDIAKIFSNEVTDEQWKAYLRGDRGVFTRRAVRLLDRTEVGVIADHYGQDAEFHDQVNHYIHDFEALLRRVMSTREGTAIATTMLSSDAGKLYVALAQAIDRLRR